MTQAVDVLAPRPAETMRGATPPPAATPPTSRAPGRLDAIDLVRGLVMVVMVLDHTRDYVYRGSFGLDPTNLAATTVPLFLTRWITHFCAPTFVFLTGVGAYLQTLRGKPARELSSFLVTRGLWLIVLEVTLVRCGAFFNLDYRFLGVLQVIWAIGVSMIFLAALVHLPLPAIGGIGLAIVCLHNLLDGIHVQGWQGPGTPVPSIAARIWFLLHQPWELFPIFGWPSPVVAVIYPLIPWIGVMAIGYVVGTVYGFDRERRRQWLQMLGLAAIGAFLFLRALNIYGDPAPWAVQDTFVFSVLSFVNTTKYPVSLLFLLMTLGPALLALAWFDARRIAPLGRPVVVFGRVPLFFYLLQWPLAHTIGLLVSYAGGQPIRRYFLNPPQLFTTDSDAGFSLWVVYVCWAVAILLLYPLCTWFAGVKQRHHSGWLRYL
jgi:uncharacterized membrane protein